MATTMKPMTTPEALALLRSSRTAKSWMQRDLQVAFLYLDAILMGIVAGTGTMILEWWLTSIKFSVYPYWAALPIAAYVGVHVTVIIIHHGRTGGLDSDQW